MLCKVRSVAEVMTACFKSIALCKPLMLLINNELEGRDTAPELTIKPLLQLKVPLSSVLGPCMLDADKAPQVTAVVFVIVFCLESIWVCTLPVTLFNDPSSKSLILAFGPRHIIFAPSTNSIAFVTVRVAPSSMNKLPPATTLTVPVKSF